MSFGSSGAPGLRDRGPALVHGARCRRPDRHRTRDRQEGLVLTHGIRAFSDAQIRELDAALVAFDEGNDPYQEHDFGSIAIGEKTVFFKMDDCDLDLQAHSPDPADPSVTRRVMTLMLAEEY
ncbi:DUF3768 domain-containing protein [Enterovirga rhinocerotis]|uniref:DUF3768 domain-containing protein n=1 Tax=Enterovirga rhinocerotis TaxID=1339210 RepID=UPI001AAD2677